MIEVFKAASIAMSIVYLSKNTGSQQRVWSHIEYAKTFCDIIRTMDMVLFSPELLQAYDPALGGYIIQIKITSSMQVPCR